MIDGSHPIAGQESVAPAPPRPPQAAPSEVSQTPVHPVDQMTANGLGRAASSVTLTAQGPAVIASQADVATLVAEVVSEAYPELAGASFRVHSFSSDAFFFRSRFAPGNLLGGRKRYVIDVNDRVFTLNLPRDAAKAILAHELAHSLFYHRHLGGKLRTLGLSQVSHRREIPFERATDMVAIRRGFADGLKAYRTWIYCQLTPTDRARKEATYFTPAEITAIESALALHPDMAETWTADPPTSLADIQDRLAARSGTGNRHETH